MIRHDFRSGAQKPPKELTKAIVRIGGKNPFGEPMFRVCLAEDRTTRAAGDWDIWDDNVPVEERGGLGINEIQAMLNQYYTVINAAARSGMTRHAVEELSIKLGNELDELLDSKLAAVPIRTDSGMADIPIYASEGWILEKWKPAETFGSSDYWERFRFNGMNALGAYPTHGEYELVAGPTPYLPTESQIEFAIKDNFHQINIRPASPRERLVLIMAKYDQRRAARDKKIRDEAEAFRKETGTIMNRVSLGAGRVRNEMAKKAGILEHIGN